MAHESLIHRHRVIFGLFLIHGLTFLSTLWFLGWGWLFYLPYPTAGRHALSGAHEADFNSIIFSPLYGCKKVFEIEVNWPTDSMLNVHLGHKSPVLSYWRFFLRFQALLHFWPLNSRVVKNSKKLMSANWTPNPLEMLHLTYHHHI